MKITKYSADPGNRDSRVDTATRLCAGGFEFRTPVETNIFSLLQTDVASTGDHTEPPIKWLLSLIYWC